MTPQSNLAVAPSESNRRTFLRGVLASGALLGLDASFLSGLAPVSARETKLAASAVRFRSDIEPLVQWLERTPRGKLIGETVTQIRKGRSYQEILAALLLAGIRNVQPRPYVGFKFHSVLVVNSAHIASLSSPDDMRWLPIFWALDYFKSTQEQDAREGDWTMRAADGAAVPKYSKARDSFVSAMEKWDEDAADAAVTGLARSAGGQEVYELLFRYGVRDFRSIGHKAIYVANSWRTLACIGWRHAEPVLRSLTYALLNHTGSENPSKIDHDADRPWRKNLERVKTIRKEWLDGKRDPAATKDLEAVIREGDSDSASSKVVEILNSGISPDTIRDALFRASSELVMRKPGIPSLHAATTTNAVQFAFRTSSNDETRRLLLLQNAAFLPLFRDFAKQRGGDLDGTTLETLNAGDEKVSGAKGLESIFDELGRDKKKAAARALAYLEGGNSPTDLINAARMLIFLKGRDAHDYKFSSAVLEDFHEMPRDLANKFMAASVALLRSAGERDNPLVGRAKEALAGTNPPRRS